MKLLDERNISTLLSSIDNILLDCDGVIWNAVGGQGIINNANIAVNKLKSLGKKIFLVTNNSIRSQESFMEKCKSVDINIEKESAVCAPYIMAHYLKKENFRKKLYIIGSQGFADELKIWGFQCVGPSSENMSFQESCRALIEGKLELDPEVGAVAVGLDGDFNMRKLIKANCYLSDPECLLIANNVDVKYPIGNGKYSIPAGGVMVRAIETVSGRQATVVGKPSKLMFEILASKHNLAPERTLMIGDTLHTDIVFGNICGMQTLLVLTGVSSLEEVEKLSSNEKREENRNFIPQYYLPSLGDILKLID